MDTIKFKLTDECERIAKEFLRWVDVNVDIK